MGDDIGIFNISAYNMGLMGSSPGNRQSARASPRSVCPALGRSCFVDDDVSDEYYSSLKEILMNTKSKLALALIATAFAATALAQQPGAAGGAAVTSEPGKAAAVCCREDHRPGGGHRQGDAHGDAEGAGG